MPIGVKPAASATATPVRIDVMCGVRKRGWMRAAQARQQPVVGHRVEDARLGHHHHDHDGAEARQSRRARRASSWRSATAPTTCPTARPAAALIATTIGAGDPVICSYGHEADHDARHEDVEDRADDQRPEDADRHVLLRVARLLRGDRDGVESDVGEEDDARAPQDAAPSVLAEGAGVRRDERMPVRRDRRRRRRRR